MNLMALGQKLNVCSGVGFVYRIAPLLISKHWQFSKRFISFPAQITIVDKEKTKTKALFRRNKSSFRFHHLLPFVSVLHIGLTRSRNYDGMPCPNAFSEEIKHCCDCIDRQYWWFSVA
jgi:hypothetical protein